DRRLADSRSSSEERNRILEHQCDGTDLLVRQGDSVQSRGNRSRGGWALPARKRDENVGRFALRRLESGKIDLRRSIRSLGSQGYEPMLLQGGGECVADFRIGYVEEAARPGNEVRRRDADVSGVDGLVERRRKARQ